MVDIADDVFLRPDGHLAGQDVGADDGSWLLSLVKSVRQSDDRTVSVLSHWKISGQDSAPYQPANLL